MARATNQEYIEKLRAQLAEAEAKAAAKAAADEAARLERLENLKAKLAEEKTKKRDAVKRVTDIHDQRIAKVEEAIKALTTEAPSDDAPAS